MQLSRLSPTTAVPAALLLLWRPPRDADFLFTMYSSAGSSLPPPSPLRARVDVKPSCEFESLPGKVHSLCAKPTVF